MLRLRALNDTIAWMGHSARRLPDRATVTLSLTDDLLLRSFTWAGWQLWIPLPGER